MPTGDYDGDTAFVFWLLWLVIHFDNPPEHYSIEPDHLQHSCFTMDPQTVEQFCAENKSTSATFQVRRLHRYLLGGLCDPRLVSDYAAMHDNLVYTMGLEHPSTVECAYKYVIGVLVELRT